MTRLNNKIQDAVNNLVKVIIEDYKQKKEVIDQCKYAVIETILSNTILIWVVGENKKRILKEANRRYKLAEGSNPAKGYLRVESVPKNEKLVEKLIPAFINSDNGFENGWETVLIETKDWTEDKSNDRNN